MTRMSIRARIALWHTLAMAAVLLAFAAGVYGFVRESQFAQIDARLAAHLAAVDATLRLGTSEVEVSELDRHALLHVYRVRERDWPLYESGMWVAADLEKAPIAATGRTIWRSPQRGIFHLRRAAFDHGGRRFDVAVGEEAEAVHRTLDRLALTLAVALPLAVLVAALGGYLLAARLLTPLGAMAQRAKAISAERLSERLDITNPNDEVGRLAAILNDTFARLEGSFDRLRRFTQDAAHELRTPLAVIRGVGEAGMQAARSPDELREAIGSMLEENDRLTRLVEGLLMLARADESAAFSARTPFDAAELTHEVVGFLRVLAEEKHQTLHCQATPELRVHADRDALRLALMNLLGNALRYTPAEGRITVRVKHAQQTEVAIEVEDTGPGIAPEHQAHLFERFYRVDSGRTRAAGGFGLGLAIARWAVRSNGGRIELDSEPGRGSCFRIVLPRA